MKAAVQDEYGPPDVVAVRDVATPRPGRSQLLVRVHATTANRTDCGYRAASPPIMRLVGGVRRPRAKILGNEFAGEVEDAGPDVTRFRAGDRVFGYIEGPFELVAGLGADRVVDYTAEDVTQDEGRYDVVLDAVGKSTFGRCRRLLTPRGIYMSTDLGPFAQNPFLAVATRLSRGRRGEFPLPPHDPGMGAYLRRPLAGGAVTPGIDRT